MATNNAVVVWVTILWLAAEKAACQVDYRECDSPQCTASPWDSRIDWDYLSTPAFCEMELLYGIAGVANQTVGAKFSIINNLEDDVITWQVVWTFEDYKDLAVDSTKGAILLSPGSEFGGPARVVNTQENSIINANGSQTDFTIAGMFSNQSLDNVESLNIRDVSVNGMRCAPLQEGICQVPLCSSSPSIPQQPFGDVSIDIPSCMSLFCCGNELTGKGSSKHGQQCFSDQTIPDDRVKKNQGTSPGVGTNSTSRETKQRNDKVGDKEGDTGQGSTGSPKAGGNKPSGPHQPAGAQPSTEPNPEKVRLPDQESSLAAHPRTELPIGMLLIGAGGLFLAAALGVLLTYCFKTRRRRKKHLVEISSEMKHLTSPIQKLISSTSLELCGSTVGTLYHPPTTLRKEGKQSSNHSHQSSLGASSFNSGESSSKNTKREGPSISRKDRSQGVFDIDFSRDVTLGPKIGSGAFGNVFKGKWRQEEVAVKMVSLTDGAAVHGDKELESLKSEIEVLSRLQHPNIICFYGACLLPPHVCILEELAVGSLATRLHGKHDKSIPLTYAEVLTLGIDISSAMAYLHPNVVHRDLKPQNVLIDGQSRAKVCDFGIAKFKENTFMTTKNVTAGTPAYMAPEMFEGQALTEKVDVFSFGVMMWESYTGLTPWKDYDNPMQIIYAVGVQGRRLPIPDECPQVFREMVQMAWHQNPQNRPSFSEILPSLRHELQKVVSNT